MTAAIKAARMIRDNVNFWENDTNMSPNIENDRSVDSKRCTDDSLITPQADRVLAPLIITQNSKDTQNGDDMLSADYFLRPSKSSILTESASSANARTALVPTRRRRRTSICTETNQQLKSVADFMNAHNREKVDLLETAMTTLEVYFFYPFAQCVVVCCSVNILQLHHVTEAEEKANGIPV